ncbi:kinase-like domain-containing protein [Coprinopsis sp. MPI-PUGE-AT-0042]|nr:kinase-like domain-containing protein [Coprinopsis sp. MPI-PUGE-AT-0042]
MSGTHRALYGGLVHTLHIHAYDEVDSFLTFPILCKALKEMANLRVLDITISRCNTSSLAFCLGREGHTSPRIETLPALKTLHLTASKGLTLLVKGRQLGMFELTEYLNPDGFRSLHDALRDGSSAISLTMLSLCLNAEIRIDSALAHLGSVCKRLEYVSLEQPQMDAKSVLVHLAFNSGTFPVLIFIQLNHCSVDPGKTWRSWSKETKYPSFAPLLKEIVHSRLRMRVLGVGIVKYTRNFSCDMLSEAGEVEAEDWDATFPFQRHLSRSLSWLDKCPTPVRGVKEYIRYTGRVVWIPVLLHILIAMEAHMSAKQVKVLAQGWAKPYGKPLQLRLVGLELVKAQDHSYVWVGHRKREVYGKVIVQACTTHGDDEGERKRLRHIRRCFVGAQNDHGLRRFAVTIASGIEAHHSLVLFQGHSGKTLRDILDVKALHPLHGHQVRGIAYQIMSGLRFLHGKSLVHTNLNPSNVLMVSDETVVYKEFINGSFVKRTMLKEVDIKIIDYYESWSVAASQSSRPRHLVGTSTYRAPETILRMSWSFAVDIYAFGSLTAELFLGDPLFYHSESVLEQLAMHEFVIGRYPLAFSDRVRRHNLQVFEEDGKVCFSQSERDASPSFSELKPIGQLIRRPDLMDLIRDCMNGDSRKRPSANKVLTHRYFSH